MYNTMVSYMLAFFFKVLKKTKLQQHFNFFINKKINDANVIVPVLGEIGKGNLTERELWMNGLFKKFFALKAGFLVDVGVNIGQTLLHYKTSYPTGSYMGFEPNPVCIYYTQKLIEANKWQQCTLIPSGIFTHSDLTEIHYYSAATDSMATVIENFRDDRKVIKKEWIPCYSAEVLIKLFADKIISVIKIDVEGAELEVLQQLFSILKKERPFVITELLPPQAGNELNGFKKIQYIQDLFNSLNYYTIRIHKNPDSSLKKLELINDPVQGLSRKLADHLFCPAEHWPIQ